MAEGEGEVSGYQCLGGCGYKGMELPGVCADCLPRFPRVHESTIRADERAKVEAEIVAWLQGGNAPTDYQAIVAAIERGEHRKP